MPRTGWLACGSVSVALLAGRIDQSQGTWLHVAGALAAVALALSLLRGRRWQSGLLVLGAALLLVRLLLGGDAGVEPARHGPTASAHRAVVTTLYAPQAGQQRAVLEITGPPETANSRAFASLPRYPTLTVGDLVEVDGPLEPAPSPEASGFAEFLDRARVGYTLRARQLRLVETALTPASELAQVRRAAGDAIARMLPEPQAGLAAAIVIGLRERVSRDVAADFRTAGLSHVVAISGFHVALVAALAGAVLSPLSRRPRSVVLLIFLVTYALLAGASPSVLRATAMAGTVLLLRIGGRRGQAAAALGMAVVALLLIDPATVTEVGFQLSVAATAGLLRWAGPFADWLAGRLPAAVPRWLIEALAVSLAAQLATLPLVLLHFGRLSVVAPISNVLAAPLIAPAMAAAGVALGTGALGAGGPAEILLAPLQLMGSLAVGALISVARMCAALPFASIELEPPLDLLSATLAAGAGLWFLRRAGPRREKGSSDLPEPRATGRASAPTARRPGLAAAAVLVAVALSVAAFVGARPDGRLHMIVLDVGQGDAVLLIGPSGSRMLVDTGPDADRLLALLDARLPAWDRRLDMVVLTHPHEDHVAGLALLLDRYRIGVIAEPGMRGLGPGDAAYRARLSELGRTTSVLAAGDQLLLDQARVDVRWPLRGRVPTTPSNGGKAVNNVSIVLDVSFGTRRLLLTGDIEEEIDSQLTAAGLGGAAAVDVLKVAHHGSATATTDAFLDRVRPRLAVISAGAGNAYGHPSPRTISRLRVAGAEVLRTDSDGSVSISTDGDDLRYEISGRRAVSAHLEEPRPAPTTAGFCPIPLPPGAAAPAYNRSDGSPFAAGSRAPAPRPRAPRLADRALERGGGRRRIYRRSHRPARPSHRPAAGRDGRAAARPGQGAARG
ncbi:MAG TPA: ComEC/Rec2 family competence protein [Candidatus Limnocylindrales bacterium]|nr:ComEC/Rec2 family competence protein [Candidatus Limnocylindrales bacterium]